jgi:uncharacterized protein (DUF2249 family)
MSTDTVDEGTYELDVRGIDGEPFGEIMDALGSLPDDETLVLVNSFEPEPLYSVLEQRGYRYETSRAAEDEWRVTITVA